MKGEGEEEGEDEEQEVTPEQYFQYLTSELIQTQRMPEAIMYFIQTGQHVEIDESDPSVSFLKEELESKGITLEEYLMYLQNLPDEEDEANPSATKKPKEEDLEAMMLGEDDDEEMKQFK
jgi:hypothetical protein